MKNDWKVGRLGQKKIRDMLEKLLEGRKVAKKIRICYENGGMLGCCVFEGHVEFQRKVGSFGLFHIFQIFIGKKNQDMFKK